MPNSYIEYTSGISGTLSIAGLNYISTSHLKAKSKATVTSDWEDVTITSVNATASPPTVTMSLSDTPAVVRIYRDSGMEPIVDFQSGVRITESDLDTATRQGLFAAQEVLENAPAHELVMPGPAGANGVGISSIGSSKTNGVTTVVITNTDASTHSFSVSDGAAGADGSAGSDTIPAGGVLETFTMPCNGQSITVGSGTYTMPDQDAALDLTTTYQDLSASQLAYTPPTGTQLVVYEFLFNVTRGDDNPIGHFKLFLDGVEVSDKRTTVYNDGGGGMQSSIKWGFQVGGSADAATGRVASWSSAKTIKVMARDYGGDNNATLYKIAQWKDTDASDTITTPFVRPQISITAIKA